MWESINLGLRRRLLFGVSVLALFGVLGAPNATAADISLAVPGISSLIQKHYDQSQDYSIEARQKLPWFASLGVYLPGFTGDNTANSAGAEIAFGYRFCTDYADFRVSARGQMYSITDAYYNQSDINVSELAFDALFRAEGLYAGPGIAFGSVTGTTNGFTFSGQNQTVFTATVGYDINPRIFVEVRYQTADVDAYKGYSLNFGYRF